MRNLGRVLFLAALVYLAILVLIAMGCGKGAGTTGPSEAPNWRGAQVSPPSVIPDMERAWQGTPKDWEPEDWRILVQGTPVPCGGFESPQGMLPAGSVCHGTTAVHERQITLWHTPRLVVDARWELCNARRWDREHLVADKGCN